MEEQLLNNLLGGLKLFFAYANWFFIGALIFIGWVLNLYTDNENSKRRKKPQFIRRIPRAYRILLLGSIIGAFFIFVLGFNTKEEVVKLVFSIFIAMGIYKLGLHRILDKKHEKTVNN
jgi:hypothetical protein